MNKALVSTMYSEGCFQWNIWNGDSIARMTISHKSKKETYQEGGIGCSVETFSNAIPKKFRAGSSLRQKFSCIYDIWKFPIEKENGDTFQDGRSTGWGKAFSEKAHCMWGPFVSANLALNLTWHSIFRTHHSMVLLIFQFWCRGKRWRNGYPWLSIRVFLICFLGNWYVIKFNVIILACEVDFNYGAYIWPDFSRYGQDLCVTEFFNANTKQ